MEMARKADRLRLRPLLERDAVPISAAFAANGSSKPAHGYLEYVSEQRCGIRQCWIALLDGEFTGHVTLHWNPLYAGIAGKGIPEIQDLNVLPAYRRRGIASRLLDQAERAAAARARRVAIGVGCHPRHLPAQRLYLQRGYIPDGLGATYDDQYVQADEITRFDDQLVIHFEKVLEATRDEPTARS
jgi:GNAT superfamily N-acetyltransferase